MNIRAVIVEDSRLARNELKLLLGAHGDIELVGEAENVDQGYDLIQGTDPDLLFLDINMPEKDGFELLGMLDRVPITIFTTAYDQFAIKSFEYNALDYLLKPVGEKRFRMAMDKVRDRLELDPGSSRGKKLTPESQIFIKDGENCWLVKIGDIFLLEVVGNYTRVHFGVEKPLLYKSLNQLEEKLPGDLFFRANRQQMVNTTAIANVVPWFNGKLKLSLTNGEDVEVSRRQSYIFKDRMSL